MNKKLTEKIVSIALCVISFMFVLLLLIVTFGHITNDDLNNKIVKGLLVSLTIIFCFLSGISIALAFKDTDKLSSVLIFKDKHSSTQATVSVMKKTAVRVCKPIEEAKIKRVNIFADDTGHVHMRVDIKIFSEKTIDVTTKVKATLITTFEDVFGIEFSSINFKVIKSKNTYQPSNAEVEKRVEELKKEITLNKPSEEKTIDTQEEVDTTQVDTENANVEVESLDANLDEQVENADSDIETKDESEVFEAEIQDEILENNEDVEAKIQDEALENNEDVDAEIQDETLENNEDVEAEIQDEILENDEDINSNDQEKAQENDDDDDNDEDVETEETLDEDDSDDKKEDE